jgi:hypothetical protein
MTPSAKPKAEETGAQDVRDALEKTNLRLRRLVKVIRNEGDAALDSKEFEVELKRARRQLRENKELLGTGSAGA